MKRLLIPLFFIACNGYAAGIQKWVDKDGNIHYGDTPPAKTQTQSIRVTRPPSNPGKPLPRFSADDEEDKEADSAKKPGDDKKQSKSSREANKEVCKKAKADRDVITRSDIIRLRQNDGSERVLSSKEIEARRIQLDNDIKKYCK